MQTPTRTSRIDALTGVRIFAALTVFIQHAVVDIDAKSKVVHSPYRGWLINAGLGVTLFFILSGFVLTWTWMDRVTPLTVRSAWSFVVARFARIYPMYLLALMSVVVFLWLRGAHTFPHIWLNVFALQTWNASTGVAFGYNGPGWSIGVELFLYACFPLLALAMRRMRAKSAVVVAIVAAVLPLVLLLVFRQAHILRDSPAVADRWLYRSPLTRLPDFVVGMALATIVRYAKGTTRWLPIAAQAIGVIGLILAMRMPITNFTIAYAKDDALWVFAVAILLWGLAAGHSTLLSRALSTKPMLLLGETSYAFYLVHVPLLMMVGLTSLRMSPKHWVVATVFWFGLTVAVAIGCHTVVERPLQKWLRRLLDPSAWRGRRRSQIDSETGEYVGRRRDLPADEPALESANV